MSDYTIEFCPGGTDYVGSEIAGTEYVDATATCSNMATTGSSEFSVGPSPTKTATKGTLQVIATVATGVDGAAAIQQIPSSTSSVPVSPTVSTTQSATTSEGAMVTSTVYETSLVYVVGNGDSLVVTGSDGSTVGASTLFQINSSDGPSSTVVSAGKETGGVDDQEVNEGWGRFEGGQWLEAVTLHQRRRVSYAEAGQKSMAGGENADDI